MIHVAVGWDQQAEAPVGLRSPERSSFFARRCARVVRLAWSLRQRPSLAHASGFQSANYSLSRLRARRLACSKIFSADFAAGACGAGAAGPGGASPVAV